jgi:hypothetical protein
VQRKRLLVGTSIAASLLAVVVMAMYEVDKRWVTSKERRLSILALSSIDEIKDATTESESLYDLRVHEAERSVAEVKSECVTKKDKDLATALDYYLNIRKQRSSDQRALNKIEQLVPDNGSDPAYTERQQDRERKMDALVDSQRDAVIRELE